MNIPHGIEHDLPDILKFTEVAHGAHGVTLHEDVAAGQELQGFQCHTVGSDQSLSTLHEFILITNSTTNLDDIAEHVVISEDFYSLLVGNTTG